MYAVKKRVFIVAGMVGLLVAVMAATALAAQPMGMGMGKGRAAGVVARPRAALRGGGLELVQKARENRWLTALMALELSADQLNKAQALVEKAKTRRQALLKKLDQLLDDERQAILAGDTKRLNSVRAQKRELQRAGVGMRANFVKELRDLLTAEQRQKLSRWQSKAGQGRTKRPSRVQIQKPPMPGAMLHRMWQRQQLLPRWHPDRELPQLGWQKRFQAPRRVAGDWLQLWEEALSELQKSEAKAR